MQPYLSKTLVLLFILSIGGFFLFKVFMGDSTSILLNNNTSKQEKVPHKTEKNNPTNNFAGSLKKNEKTPIRNTRTINSAKIDFILISPSPTKLVPGERVELKAFGFSFKNKHDYKPSERIDPQIQSVKKQLARKYNWLGSVPVTWKLLFTSPKKKKTISIKPRSLSFATPNSFANPARWKGYKSQLPIPICSLSVNPANASIAYLKAISGYGEVKVGILARLKSQPSIYSTVSVMVYDDGRSLGGQSWLKNRKLAKRISRKFCQHVLFKPKGESNEHLYGQLIYRRTDKLPFIIRSKSRRTWRKDYLLKSFDFSEHRSFLNYLKSSYRYEKKPFSYYEYTLFQMRYESLSETGTLNTVSIETNIEARIRKENLPSPKAYTAAKVLEDIKTYSKDFLFASAKIRTNKNIRNQLYLEVWDLFLAHKRKNKKDNYYYDLLNIVCMIGVATPELEQEFVEYYKSQGLTLPEAWKHRHTWWQNTSSK